jgi:hypothetical protein
VQNRELIRRALGEAGFTRDAEPDSYTLSLPRGSVRFGMTRVTDDIGPLWWTVDLDISPPGESPYRAGRPTLDAPVELVLRRERGLDGLGKRFGVNREVELGDPSFDREVYVESDGSDEEVRAIVGPAFRELALRILGAGVTALKLRASEGRLTALWEGHFGELTPDRLRKTAELVLQARDELPRFRRLAPQGAGGPTRHQSVGLVVLLVAAIGALGVAFVYQRGEPWPAVTLVTVVAAAVGAAVIVATSWIVSRGSSVGLRHMLVMAIPGVIAWVSWTLLVSAWAG